MKGRSGRGFGDRRKRRQGREVLKVATAEDLDVAGALDAPSQPALSTAAKIPPKLDFPRGHMGVDKGVWMHGGVADWSASYSAQRYKSECM